MLKLPSGKHHDSLMWQRNVAAFSQSGTREKMTNIGRLPQLALAPHRFHVKRVLLRFVNFLELFAYLYFIPAIGSHAFH